MIKLNVEMIRQLGEKFVRKDYELSGLQKVQTIMDSLYKYMDEEFIKAVKKDKSLTRFIITLGYRDRLKLVYNSKTRLIFLENKNITNYENSIRRPINKVVLPNVEFGMKNVIHLQDIVYPVCKILWNECVKRNDYCIGHVSHLDKSSDRPTEILDNISDKLDTKLNDSFIMGIAVDEGEKDDIIKIVKMINVNTKTDKVIIYSEDKTLLDTISSKCADNLSKNNTSSDLDQPFEVVLIKLPKYNKSLDLNDCNDVLIIDLSENKNTPIHDIVQFKYKNRDKVIRYIRISELITLDEADCLDFLYQYDKEKFNIIKMRSKELPTEIDSSLVCDRYELNTRDKYQLPPARRISASEIIKLAKEKKDPILNTMLQRKSHDEEFKRIMVEQFKNKAEERARNITDSYNKSKEDNDYVLSRSIELFKGMGDECIDHLDLVEITNNNCYSKRPGFKNIFMSLTSGFLDKTLFDITEKDGIINNIKMKNEKGFISTYEETIEIIERNLTQIFKITCYLDKRNPYLPYVVYTTLDDTNMRNICMVEVFNNTRQNDRLLMAEYTVIKGEFKPSLLNCIIDYRDTRFDSVYKAYRSTNNTRTPQITDITYKSNGAYLTHDLKSGRIIMNDIERETHNIMNILSEETNK